MVTTIKKCLKVKIIISCCNLFIKDIIIIYIYYELILNKGHAIMKTRKEKEREKGDMGMNASSN